MSAPLVKLVVDCSQAGALAPDAAAALADQLQEAALGALKKDDLEKAKRLIQEAKDVVATAATAASAGQLVELTKAEVAEHQAGQAGAHRGHLLAQIQAGLVATDHDVVTAHELDKPIPKKIAAHRQKLRDLTATVEAAHVGDLAKIKIPDPPTAA